MGSELSAIQILFTLLSKGRFDYSEEYICQNQIEDFLKTHNVTYVREFELKNGVCDFYFPKSKLVLEVKAGKDWSKRSVFRQCERYCDDSNVSGLILATGKIQGMPNFIKGKPVLVYQLGVGFL